MISYLRMNEYNKELVKKYTRGRSEFSDTDSGLIKLAKQVGVLNKDVLDLGSGDGRYAAMLLKMGARNVKGIDISPEMIELARGQHEDIEFILGDCLQMPFEDESFDIVFSNYALHYCESAEKAFKEISRVLKKGGCFIGIFNAVDTDSHEILNKAMPIFLGNEDEVLLYNLMKLDEEYDSAIEKAGLETVERIIEPNVCASIDPSFEYYSKIKQLKTMMFLCRK